MRISDWGSDVCSSDLEDLLSGAAPQRRERGSGPEEPRPGFEDSAWFRMSVGRRQKADARWLLPLLCRRGHITKREVGAIRIGESETYVQIPRIAAKKFSDALKRSAGDGEDADRSEERRVGKECVSTCRSRWSPYH